MLKTDLEKPGFYAFLRQYPQIKMSRTMACTKESILHGLMNLRNFVRLKVLKALIKFITAMCQVFPYKLLHLCVDKHCRRNFQIASNNKVSVTTLQCICANGKTLIQNILLASLTIFIWDLQRMAQLKHRSFAHG